MKKIFTLCAAALVSVGAFAEKWVPLFNDVDLTGWKQVTGTSTYEVKDKMIIGTGSEGTVNSFLATERNYSDFILEFEFKMEDEQNSGICFRSRVNEQGFTMGYQYEFDPSDRAWTGGIYDERRRGWLYPMTFNAQVGKLFKRHAWNKGRIEAVGNHIYTYLNGKLAAAVVDDMDRDGFIALQVHAPGKNPKRVGSKVWWRNIRICTETPEKYVTKRVKIHEVNANSNTLSESQVKDGWKLLWDGKTTEGWVSARNSRSFPEKGWKIENGELCVLANDGRESQNGGDIMTKKKYTDFWLSVEFKITPGANSGIKYFINPDLYPSNASAIGCEYQILDDELHPDAKLGVAGNRTLGSLYDLIRADKENAGFRKTQWNTAWIKVTGNHVEHWLNGVKILEYERNNQMFNALVQYSKFKDRKNFGNHKSGHILLQDHGDEVRYKSIMIKEL